VYADLTLIQKPVRGEQSNVQIDQLVHLAQFASNVWAEFSEEVIQVFGRTAIG
jgi:hypothetical protein